MKRFNFPMLGAALAGVAMVAAACAATPSTSTETTPVPTTVEDRTQEQARTIMVGNDRFMAACDGHGHLIITRWIRSGAQHDQPFQVVADPSCGPR